MSLKPWGGSVVLFQVQALPRICVVQFCDYEPRGGTANIQKEWREGEELGNKMGENRLDIQGTHTSKNSLRRLTVVCEYMQSDFIGQWFPRGGLPNSSISITWELKKTANSQVHLEPMESETVGFGEQVCCEKSLQEILTRSEVYGDLWERLNAWGGR